MKKTTQTLIACSIIALFSVLFVNTLYAGYCPAECKNKGLNWWETTKTCKGNPVICRIQPFCVFNNIGAAIFHTENKDGSCNGNPVLCHLNPFCFFFNIFAPQEKAEPMPCKAFDVTAVDLATAYNAWKREKVVFVDALSPESFAKEHIPGAINLPANDPESNWSKFEKIEKSKDIIVYCANVCCPASEKVAHFLEGKGYKTVLEFSGGLEEWKAAGNPLEGSK